MFNNFAEWVFFLMTMWFYVVGFTTVMKGWLEYWRERNYTPVVFALICWALIGYGAYVHITDL